MLYYIVSSLFMIHFIIQNMGPIFYNLVRLISKVQLMICPPPPHKTPGNSLDLLMNDMICEYHVDNAFNWINLSEFAVLKSGKHRICFYPPIESYIPEYEPSQVQFISVKIEIDSTEYTLRLQTPEYSFYVVHNEINVDFVRYYFIKYYHKMVLPVDVKYVITIIDDNVQFITLDETQILVFEPNSYLIYNPEEQDQEQEEDDEDDISIDRMIEIGEEIDAENVEGIPLLIEESDLEMEHIISEHEKDLEMDKFIADYDMAEVVIFDNKDDSNSI